MLKQEFNWKKEVLESKEPVLVDFWAPWCGPCRLMSPVIESLARDHPVYQVNIDNNQALAARYKVSAVPTLMIFRDGKVAHTHVGMATEDVLRGELRELQSAK